MFLSLYCNLLGRTLMRLTENHVIMEKLNNPVSHISVLFRLRVKEKNMRRSRISKRWRRRRRSVQKERNSFCCNAWLSAQWNPHSCQENGQKLVHQLIFLRLQGLNIDLKGSVGGSISDWFNYLVTWPKSIRLSQCREEYFNYTQILKYRCCNIFGNK